MPHCLEIAGNDLALSGCIRMRQALRAQHLGERRVSLFFHENKSDATTSFLLYPLGSTQSNVRLLATVQD